MSQTTSYPWTPIEKRPDCCEPVPFLEAQNLSLHYRDKAAFEAVSLSVFKGCITAFVGPSGCGKTSFLTSLNRLSDLVPGCRVTGSLRLGGQDVRDPSLDVAALRRKVGMIFQKPNPFPLSIRRNILFPLREHGLTDKALGEERLEKVLRQVGLWGEVKDRLDAPAQALSGGQQQRLCIGRALALEPEALLMDEPCSALDPLSSGIVEDLVQELRGKYTVLIVTHNLPQARRIADYVAFFWVQNQAGRLVEYGPAKQIFGSPKDELTSAYIQGIRG
jgi:phosphate transport system ATP-binding protein